MKSKRREPILIERLTVTDAGSEGMAVARHGEKVVFIPYAAPGDIVDVLAFRRKKSFLEGRIERIHEFSDKRTSPLCSHFGLCGGCKWQHLDYTWQLFYKEKQVRDNLERIAGIQSPLIRPIIASDSTFYYRNKLEFTFSNRKWLTDGAAAGTKSAGDLSGLGFHLPGMFDRILDIDHCYLQQDPSNAIRLAIRDWGIQNQVSFYDVRNHEGVLRNLIVRNSRSGELMVIIIAGSHDEKVENDLFQCVMQQFPEINSLIYVVNNKKNDTINDLDYRVIKGNPFISESMDSPVIGNLPLTFRIGPVSFYQTNPIQAEKLYKAAFDLAEFSGNELVYDLYTGAGTIACYVASSVKKVIGIEYIEDAIKDAKINASINNIHNATFIAGDMVNVLNDQFLAEHGKPDVIITDPPRSGMHPKVVEQLMSIGPGRIVYFSCNPATQARDLQMMKDIYDITAIQPFDMFPQTQHVENIIRLDKRK
ncbi:MAG: 23S rRNA (uracil(1939)-C(5))-methyltransferase RlmD [Bacteroidales bacterium]|nr:23S rRNA (uracil(1939)-C(5))-methyltransferase RlmD [Bacteroidales bacterium]